MGEGTAIGGQSTEAVAGRVAWLHGRWRQTTSLEASVWDMLLGGGGQQYGYGDMPTWQPDEVRVQVEEILSRYEKMAAEADSRRAPVAS